MPGTPEAEESVSRFYSTSFAEGDFSPSATPPPQATEEGLQYYTPQGTHRIPATNPSELQLDVLLLTPNENSSSPAFLYGCHPIFVGYSEKAILPILNNDGRCIQYTGETTISSLIEAKNRALQNNEVFVRIGEEDDVFPRYSLYIVQDDKDLAIINDVMELNHETGNWYTAPRATVALLLENYELQEKNHCDKGAAVAYPAGFTLAAASQVAIFKIVFDLTDNLGAAVALTTIIALGAMFYMKAAYSDNLYNQKRVDFHPGTVKAQSIFVNSVSLEDFGTTKRSQLLFAMGAPLATTSISADVGLTVAKMSGNIGVGFGAVVLKSIEDLLTNSLRAMEQLRLIHPVMPPAYKLPVLGAVYRSRAGQVTQKTFIAATPAMVSFTYAYAAFSLLTLFSENPALGLRACLGLFGLMASLGTVPLYSLFELGAAERSLARTHNPLSDDSRLRFFQKMGRAQSRDASNSLPKQAAYTFFHSAAQGPAIGVGINELLLAFVPELSTATKGTILLFGCAVALMFALSKNKRVFEQPEKQDLGVLPPPAGMRLQ